MVIHTYCTCYTDIILLEKKESTPNCNSIYRPLVSEDVSFCIVLNSIHIVIHNTCVKEFEFVIRQNYLKINVLKNMSIPLKKNETHHLDLTVCSLFGSVPNSSK